MNSLRLKGDDLLKENLVGLKYFEFFTVIVKFNLAWFILRYRPLSLMCEVILRGVWVRVSVDLVWPGYYLRLTFLRTGK